MDSGIFSAALFAELRATLPAAPPAANPLVTGPFGFPVRTSNHFPFVVACSPCAGTGDGGEDATYCRQCKGGGRIRYEGALVEYGGKMTLITVHFDKLFQPSFPFALPVRPLPNRGTFNG